ncbi:hypothetical protein KM043_014983 [Ampulex compressa]|nr:hypothetical protein KM043_014983 [Ampulex compressa]
MPLQEFALRPLYVRRGDGVVAEWNRRSRASRGPGGSPRFPKRRLGSASEKSSQRPNPRTGAEWRVLAMARPRAEGEEGGPCLSHKRCPWGFLRCLTLFIGIYNVMAREDKRRKKETGGSLGWRPEGGGGGRERPACRELSRSGPQREEAFRRFLPSRFHRKEFSARCLGKKRIFLIGDTCAALRVRGKIAGRSEERLRSFLEESIERIFIKPGRSMGLLAMVSYGRMSAMRKSGVRSKARENFGNCRLEILHWDDRVRAMTCSK